MEKTRSKINYQKKMEDILAKESEKGRIPKLLLHSCCAPCSTYVLEYLSPHFDIGVLYYNPNIHPSEEYYKREAEQKRFIDLVNKVNKIELIQAEYNPQEYFDAIKGFENDKEGGLRCGLCFDLRLNEAAKYAKEHGYDYFTTTLSISPHKNADLINHLGELLESKYDVSYLYADFKKKNGFKRSIELCKQYDVYRQNYCGCIFSLKEAQERMKDMELKSEDQLDKELKEDLKGIHAANN